MLKLMLFYFDKKKRLPNRCYDVQEASYNLLLSYFYIHNVLHNAYRGPLGTVAS